MRILASDAAANIGGRLHGPDVHFEGVSWDSRTTRPGQLFVPIVADRDGHQFIGAARAAGAVAHLSSRPDPYRRDGTAIGVADTSVALMALAQWARKRLGATVIGVTGSVGKTSTKDLIAAAVGAARRVTASERSFNNEQGLPTTVLNAPDDVEALVLEMGMRGFGEISRLCEVARPSIGVVTAVGHSHTGRVGGIEGVARAKAELVVALPRDGAAILNADDPRVAAMAERTAAEVITYGAGGDVRADSVEMDELARARIRVSSPWGSGTAQLAVPGTHMASNALAAVAVAGRLGVPLDATLEALSTATVSGMRMEVTTTRSGATIVNDAYNANPTSMRAALDALAAMRARRRVAVLGPMAELDDAAAGHRSVIEHARALGIGVIATGTELYGVEPVGDPASALADIGEGDVVLIKASRLAGLEAVVEALMDPAE